MQLKKIIPNYAKIINTESGEIETVAVEIIKNRNNSKKGWSRMYRFNYDDVIRKITSEKEFEIFVAIRESNIKKTFALNFNQTATAKQLDTSRNTVARVVKKMRDTGFIMKIDNVYFINSHIYVPPMISDEDVAIAQSDWDKHKELEQ